MVSFKSKWHNIFLYFFYRKKKDLGSCQICADKQCVHMISQVVSEVSKEKDWKALPSHRLWLRLLKIRLALIAHFDNWSLPNWPIWPSFEVNGLDWQCCLAGSSNTAPRIFIFFNCPGCRIFILCEIHWDPCPRIFDT